MLATRHSAFGRELPGIRHHRVGRASRFYQSDAIGFPEIGRSVVRLLRPHAGEPLPQAGADGPATTVDAVDPLVVVPLTGGELPATWIRDERSPSVMNVD